MPHLPRIVVPALLLPLAMPAQTVPTGFLVETVVASGIDQPTDFCFLPDGRCLIVSRTGQIAVHAGATTTAASIGSVPNVDNFAWSPTTLPSIAADPGFATNGHVYVLYASTLDYVLHLDRFTLVGALANPTSSNLQLQVASRHVLLAAIPDWSPGDAGTVRFGPDGMLYVAVDDDDSACSAQQLASQSGCILRLDVGARPAGGSLVPPPYGALDPGDNPMSASTNAAQLVIANGLHRPARMEIDAATGNVYVGDVGAIGPTHSEEVSEYVRPTTGTLPFVNFGWPWFEGTVAAGGCGGPVPPGLTGPIATVPHTAGWERVVAGAVYRNQQGFADFGGAYEGNLFFLDHTTGQLRRLVQAGGWQPAAPVAGQPTPNDWGSGFQGTVTMRVGPDGAIWFLQQQAPLGGLLRRVRPPGSMPSVVAISGSGQRTPAGEPFAQPLVVRVFDALLNPLPGAPVDFTLLGGGALSTTNPVLADAQGFAQTTVTSTFGGAITVTATTPGSVPTPPFRLFGRRLSTSLAGSLFFVQIDNETDAAPPLVPYLVMLAWPGSPTLPTPIGPLCVAPNYALAVVFEDGIGVFGGVSLSGAGALGMPGLYRQYSLPPGLLTGLSIRFQAVGVDPVTGWFRTNCTTRQF